MIHDLTQLSHKEKEDSENCRNFKCQDTVSNCSGDSPSFITTNLEPWMNFDQKANLFEVILPYLVFIVLVTAFLALKIRQEIKRAEEGKPTATPSVVFDDISRINADESLMKLLKFLVNYGFYKFGVEISLVLFVIVIFTRSDYVALFYTFWFGLLVLINREKLEIPWIFSTVCIMIITIFQCFVFGSPIVIDPCQEESSNSLMSSVLHSLGKSLSRVNSHTELLVFDFILLTAMSSQVRLNLF